MTPDRARLHLLFYSVWFKTTKRKPTPAHKAQVARYRQIVAEGPSDDGYAFGSKGRGNAG